VIPRPYIVGFDYARVSQGRAAQELSEKFHVDEEHDERYYRDPRYTGSNVSFHPKFDVYSLGILLWEIGLWQPRMGKVLDGFLTKTSEERKILREKGTARLAFAAGWRYASIVEACLWGEFRRHGEKGPCAVISTDHLEFELQLVMEMERICNGICT
jgi:hypothetical protein